MADKKSIAYQHDISEELRNITPKWCSANKCQSNYLKFITRNKCMSCKHCDKRKLSKKRWENSRDWY
jgi:roadblock/LC7 domain-containing protein